jgi:glycosyltransferase involved in cell wall biosynthesis
MFAKDVPWPRTNGYRLRLASQVEGLARVGDVELVALSRDPSASTANRPASIDLHRYLVLPYPDRDGPVVRLARWITTRRPRRLMGGEWAEAVPQILDRIDTEADLVWWSHTDAWVVLGDAIRGSSILDYDNIESARIGHRRSTRPAETGERGPSGALHRGQAMLSRTLDAVDERRWQRLERKAEIETDATVVCSHLDLERTTRVATHVIPNGYEPPFERSEARPVDQDNPTLLFVGLLTYEANADGLEWFVTDVLPLVTQRYPRVSVRVVGRITDDLTGRIEGPHVEILGEVRNLAPELEHADVAIVPLRIGGGTRLKIIEAFATGIPVVSTSVGAEGLGVEPGTHLLIGDTPESFATACCDIISDDQLRDGLVRSGHAHFDRHFRWSAVCDQVAELATATLSPREAGERT